MIKQKHQEAHLRDERRLLGEMSGCPWIVQLHRTFEDDCNVYMLLEYLKGGELFTLLRRASCLSTQDTLFYASEIVCALDALHSKGIAYRDLKPENVLLDQYGHVKLVDMGFAKKIGSKKTTTMCGTPEYLAPEIVLGLGHNCAADWWSLGVLIYELLAGFSPFSANTFQETYHRISRASYCFPDHFDSVTKDLISKLLVPNPDFRLGNMRGGTSDIMMHPFFSSINWNEVRSWSGKPSDLNDDSGSENTISPSSPRSEASSSDMEHIFVNFDATWMPQEPAFDFAPSHAASPLATSSASLTAPSSLFSSSNTLSSSNSTLNPSGEATLHPLFPLVPSPLHCSASHSSSMTGITELQHIRLATEEKITWSQAQGGPTASQSLSSSQSAFMVTDASKCSAASSFAAKAAVIADATNLNAPPILRTSKKPTIVVKQRKSSRRQTRISKRQPKSQRSLKGRFENNLTKASPVAMPPLQLTRLTGVLPNRHSDLDGYSSPHSSPTTACSESRMSDMFTEELEVDDSHFSSPETSPREAVSILPAPSHFVPLSSSPAPAFPLHVMPIVTANTPLHAPSPWCVSQGPIASHASPSWGYSNPMQFTPYSAPLPPHLSTMPQAALHASFPTPLPPKACHRPHLPPFVPADDKTADESSLFDHYAEDAALHLPLHNANCPASCTSSHTHLETLVFGSHGLIINRYGCTEIPFTFDP